MIIFFAISLTVLTFAFITYPLFRQKLYPEDTIEDEERQELRSRRDTTYSMLKELEFDFQSGILSEDDYQDLETRYKRKAVSILRDMDDLEKGADIDDEIEKLVLEMRRGKGADVEKENEIAEPRQTEERFCPQCGERYQEGVRFCSHCGTRLRQGETG